MIKKILLLVMLFPLLCLGQDFHWGYQTVESSNAIYPSGIRSIAVDHLGNVYATGFFHEVCDFDNSSNNYFLSTPANHMWDGFVMKLDKDRNFLWAKHITSLGNGQGISIILDQNENIIVSGLTSGMQIDLDPDPVSQFLINSDGSTGGFIIKLNPNGDFINGSFTPGFFIKESAVDSQNNIITMGIKNGIVYVKKSDTNLNLVWERTISGNDVFLRGIAIDSNDNIILTGNFRYSMVFEGITYTWSNDPDAYGYTDFICKMSSSGDGIWCQKLGDTGSAAISTEDKSILIDNSDNIYFSSSYLGTSLTFNGHQVTLPYAFGTETSIFKIDQNGNYLWNVPIYGDERQEAKTMAFNSVGEIYVHLFANDEAYVLDTTNTTTQVYNLGMYRGILLKLNQNGNYLNSTILAPNGTSLVIDFEDNILIGGRLIGEGYDFDPGPGTYTMGGFRGCGYIFKLGPCDSFMPSALSSQRFCSSENATVSDLTPNSSITKWYASLTSPTPLTGNEFLVNGQTYYVTKKVGSCPESPRAPVTVIINQNPVPPSIASNPVLCESDYTTLIDLPIVFVPGLLVGFYDALTGGNQVFANTFVANNVNYYVSQISNGCASDRTLINATVISSSTGPAISTSQTFCVQQNATINDIDTNNLTVDWHDAAFGGNLLASTTALQPGIYYASQTSGSCASISTEVLITIQNTSPPNGNNQILCGTQNPTLNDVVINGTAIKWYQTATSTVQLPLTTVLSDNTTYYATQTVNGCESTSRLPITISLIYSLNATNYAETICDDGNDGELVTLSNYNSYLISPTVGHTITYYNTLANAQIESPVNQYLTYSLNWSLNTLYARINSSNGCYQIVELQLTLVKEPIVTIPDEIILCEKERILVSAGTGFDSYTWSTGAGSNAITITQAGNYSVTVTQNHGAVVCSSTKNFTVVLSNAPTITSIDTVDWTDNQNSITVTVSGLGDYEYSIDGINFQDSNVFNGLLNGDYTVTVKDKNKCGIATAQVFLLNYPKFFSPNGDGTHDGWSVKFSQFEPNFEVRIFDRYGKLLRVMNNREAWDGNFNGKAVPSDDYWFNVIRDDGRIHKGHFALLR